MSMLNPRVSQFQRQAVARSYNGNPQIFKELHQQLFELAIGFIYGRDTYYEKADKRLQKLRTLVDKIVQADGADGARFIADVALFTREVGGLRSAPVVLLTELAKAIRTHNVNPQLYALREHVRETIQRVDELTDLYAYAMGVFGGKGDVPMSIKKGVADAFGKFDAYQFGKYNRDGLKLKDLMRIVHPKPIDEEQARVFSALIKDELEAPQTHEVAFSLNGQLPKADRRADASIWLEFLKRDKGTSGSLGLLAIIRNLKRMANADLSATGWDLVRDRLMGASDREISKLLAFNLINSYNYAKAAGVPSHVLGALSRLTERSFGYLPSLGDRVLIIFDSSGSMNDAIKVPAGAKPLVDLNTPSQAAALFAVALLKQAALNGKRAALIRFSTDAEFINLNPADSVNSMYDELMEHVHGGGTNLEKALELMTKELGWKPDTVFILSDMQVDVFMGKRRETLWGQNVVMKPVDVNKYFTAGATKKVAFNFNSYESTPVGEDQGWFQMAGWNPNVFKFLALSETAGSMAQAIFAHGPSAWRSKPEWMDEEV